MNKQASIAGSRESSRLERHGEWPAQRRVHQRRMRIYQMRFESDCGAYVPHERSVGCYEGLGSRNASRLSKYKTVIRDKFLKEQKTQ